MLDSRSKKQAEACRRRSAEPPQGFEGNESLVGTVNNRGQVVGRGWFATQLHSSHHSMHYNFARTHKTLGITPAMAAGF